MVSFIVSNNIQLKCATFGVGTAVAIVLTVFVNTFNTQPVPPALCLRLLTTQTNYVKTTSLTDACAS
jgi:hypothetical protein